MGHALRQSEDEGFRPGFARWYQSDFYRDEYPADHQADRSSPGIGATILDGDRDLQSIRSRIPHREVGAEVRAHRIAPGLDQPGTGEKRLPIFSEADLERLGDGALTTNDMSQTPQRTQDDRDQEHPQQ